MSEFPLISIGVSAYNRANYLPLCLNSLLDQSYPNCEIIVVDDGSADNTAELMRQQFPQIKYIYQENAGDAAAKNHAAEVACGEYIVFNDSDDLFLPDTVAQLFAALPADGNGISYGTYRTIDADGKALPTKRKVAHYPSGMITGDLLMHILVNSCGTLMPRKLFLEYGGFDRSLRVSHDYDLFLRMSLDNEFYAVQEPVFLRRRHGGNLSSGSYDKINVVLGVVERFLAAHPELEKRYERVIRTRRGDFHRKLYREARREQRKEAVRIHAAKAFEYNPGIKRLWRMLTAGF